MCESEVEFEYAKTLYRTDENATTLAATASHQINIITPCRMYAEKIHPRAPLRWKMLFIVTT